MVTTSYKVPLELLIANAIWAVTEIPRQSLVSLCINSLADLTDHGHQRSLWWTRPTFGLHLHRFCDCLSNTHCVDNGPSWKLEVFALLGVRIPCLSPCNPEGWFLTQTRIQGAWRRSGFSVSGHISAQQLGPKLSYTMLNLWLSRGRDGSRRRVLCVFYCSGAFSTPLTETSIGCGDVEDITNNGGTTALETDCTTACSGDPLHLCGGPQRLQLYLWNGTLNNWQIPANIGRYEVRTKCPLLILERVCYKAIQCSISFPASYLRCLPPSASMARFLSSRKAARLSFRTLPAHTNST